MRIEIMFTTKDYELVKQAVTVENNIANPTNEDVRDWLEALAVIEAKKIFHED